ncbi:hypothetical protein C2E25_16590 [Geothermobacter hydrogeniphilus]|uniref:Lipoprotein n=1 Tax=Geothermobacter hydrogeniphilus TaxID=1969733 RepID=A0A2K2H5R8_9BACT|nr:hypothetical protein C2E25_16590 [Geothermobacter hydrogeniphilus]
MALSVTACGPNLITKKDAFPKMYSEQPVAILVLPPINQSTAAEAKQYYETTIAQPLTMKGYYVFPLEVVDDLLENEGVYATEELLNIPPQTFKEQFGADAVMFILIDKWDTSYYVVGGSVKVAISYILKSTETGETLWQYKDSLKVDTTGQNRAGGIAGLVLQLAETAINTAMTDYVPIAGRVNNMALVSMPYGKYSALNGKDMNQRVVFEEKVKPQ